MNEKLTNRTEQSSCKTGTAEGIRLLPEEERRLQPILPGAFETVAAFCREALQKRYGGAAPEEAQARLEYELGQLQSRELDSSVLLILHRLAQGLRKKGHLLIARAALPSFYTAWLLGLTETDPLALRVPHEALWGQVNRLCYSDFNVSEECWEDAEQILTQMFPQGRTVYEGHSRMIGGGAGDPKTASVEKYFCPHIRFFFPDAAGLEHRLPIQKIDGEDTVAREFGFSHTLFRLTLLPTRTMGLLRRLEELTGTPQSSIRAEEAAPLLVQDQTDLPEFAIPAVQALWSLAKPETLEDIIKISALAHGTGAWLGNADELLREGTVPLGEIIASREDVFERLTAAGLDRAFAYGIMERVRRGKGLEEACASDLRAAGIPEWFIRSCGKIEYLFPKAHCAEVCVLPALKAAWYRAHFPKEYAQANSELPVEKNA